MRERFQHWFDVSLAEPRHRVSAVWFIGRGRPQEKHAPLQLMVLLAIPVTFLACWNVVSLPILWKEWRRSHHLIDSMVLVDEGIEDMISTHEPWQRLDDVQPRTPEPKVITEFQPDLAPLLYPHTRAFEPDLTPATKVEATPVAESVTESIAEPAVEPEPEAPKEIARMGQWQRTLTDDGVEIVFNVGNRRGGKLSGYLWGLATYETESGETHIVGVPDSITSSDDRSPDDVKDGEHFATKRFRRTHWNLVAPVAEPGRFSKIVVGVTDEGGQEILREVHKL